MSATGLGTARNLLTRARAELAAEHWDEAVNRAREALEAAPTEPEAMVQAALVLVDAGEATSAVPVLEEAVKAHPRNAAYPVFLGLACMDAGQNEKAHAMFDHALEMQPENLLAAGFRIVLALREQETERALDLLKGAGVEASRRLTGRLLMEVERTVRRLEGHEPRPPEPASEADGSPSASSGSAPAVASPVDDSPSKSHAAGQTDGPVPDQASKPGGSSDDSPAPVAPPADPTEAVDSPATSTPGQPVAAEQATNPPAARSAPPGLLSQLVDPFVSQYLLWRTERALVGSRLEEATSLAREAVERSRESPRALSTLGMCLLQAHQAEEALEVVLEAAKVDGETPDVLYLKGCCLQELGRLSEARETLLKMLAGFAKDAPAMYTLGQIELQEGNLLLARRYFEQAANLDFLVVQERLDHLRRLVDQGPPPAEDGPPASTPATKKEAPVEPSPS